MRKSPTNTSKLLTMLLLGLTKPKMKWAVPLSTFAIMGISAHVAVAQTAASVNGVVRDAQGNPIHGATVTIQNTSPSFNQVTTTTDQGTASFTTTPGACS